MLRRGYYQNFKQYSLNTQLNLEELEVIGKRYTENIKWKEFQIADKNRFELIQKLAYNYYFNVKESHTSCDLVNWIINEKSLYL